MASRGLQLREGEQPIYTGRPSWRALFSFYAGGLVVAALAFVILWLLVDTLAGGLLAAAAIVAVTLVVGYLRRLFTTYVITDQRLRISHGFVRRRVQETRLDRVQNVNFEQGMFDRMLNVGSVDFDTAGTDDSEFVFEWVNGPEEVVRSVNEAIADYTEAQRRSL
jgi:uncharacterized membrane protein YdbT with pleckstrin-like domain